MITFLMTQPLKNIYARVSGYFLLYIRGKSYGSSNFKQKAIQLIQSLNMNQGNDRLRILYL